MNYTVITVPRCPLMLEPTHTCEQVDEMLLGWRAEILERAAPGWVKVRADYRYEGFAPTDCLSADEEQAAAFLSLPKALVTKGYCTVMAAPNVQSWLLADLPRGALVAPLGERDDRGWIKVALPDGREGYTKGSFLGEYHSEPYLDEAGFRQAVCDAAKTYLGSHYRWGGKSPLGLDCSGLTFMSYWSHGVSIYRDAQIRPDFPVHEIDRGRMKRGDLLFFPGHVALYLGEGRFIHSTSHPGSDGVVINSLDPAHPDYRADLAEKLSAVGSIF